MAHDRGGFSATVEIAPHSGFANVGTNRALARCIQHTMSDTANPAPLTAVATEDDEMVYCPLNEEFLQDALDALLRGDPHDLDGYLILTGKEIKIDGLKINVHCHSLACTQNGARTGDLARMLGARIMDYAIPRSQWAAAKTRDTAENTDRHSGELRLKAKALFTSLKKSGEGGEMLLYLLLQTYLRLPQLLCKMALKTSGNVHVHGADGIHVDIDSSTGHLILYWGESKLYKSLSAALRESLKGLHKYLTDSGGSSSPLDRDLCLLRDNLDLDNDTLTTAILRLLDRDNPAYNQIEYRGAALVGFNSKAYPTGPNQLTGAQVENAVKAAFPDWMTAVRTALGAQEVLKTYHLEIFLVPFPTVAAFRTAFHKEIR